MARRLRVVMAAMMAALALFAGPAVAQDNPGRAYGPPEGDEPICDERHNNLSSQADPIELEDGDVEEKTATNDDGEEVTFWVVHHGVEYQRAVYREPARLGPDNFCLGGSDVGSFWFGIAGPDLTRIEHQGQVRLYFEDANGDWHSLRAQFDGRGQLLHVNGVEPQ